MKHSGRTAARLPRAHLKKIIDPRMGFERGRAASGGAWACGGKIPPPPHATRSSKFPSDFFPDSEYFDFFSSFFLDFHPFFLKKISLGRLFWRDLAPKTRQNTPTLPLIHPIALMRRMTASIRKIFRIGKKITRKF